MPHQWHISRIAAIHKKGDLSDCANYRPISIIVIAYKILAQVLLQRLKTAGAEKRISESQFGFKSGTGTIDALFLTRRAIDKAIKQNSLLFWLL